MQKSPWQNFGVTLFFIAAIGLSGCGDKLFPYEDSVYGIKIKYPKGWTIREQAKGTVVAFVSPKDKEIDAFQENVNILVQDLKNQPNDLQQYSMTAVRQLTRTFKNITVLDSKEVTWAGRPAYRFEYMVKAEFDLRLLHLWTIENGKAYMLTYSADADHYKDYIKVVERMIRSFEISQ